MIKRYEVTRYITRLRAYVSGRGLSSFKSRLNFHREHGHSMDVVLRLHKNTTTVWIQLGNNRYLLRRAKYIGTVQYEAKCLATSWNQMITEDLK